ncbi:protein PALS2 isoform X1 [Lepeophtheirus salmonis]|uniref:protein PALS2 isoform X1 n=2 Tax=Lepeophtheirus salmonis TaxID=72036 RepID=UPI003AF4076A
MELVLKKNTKNISSSALSRRESGIAKVLGKMTKKFSNKLARSADILFLKDLVVNKACDRAKKALQDEAPKSWLPITHDSIRLIEQAKSICEQRIYLDEAKELFSLISSKWLHAVLEIHDEVAAQIQNNTEEVEYIDGVSSIDCDDEELGVDDKRRLIFNEPEGKGSDDKKEEEEVRVDTFRVVGIRRQVGETMGLTVRVENGRITVARILSESLIDRQGLLRVGDVILEANGKKIRTPEELLKIFEGKSDLDEIRSSGKLSTITTVSSSGAASNPSQAKERTLNSVNLDEELEGNNNPYDVNEFITLKIEPAMTDDTLSTKDDDGKHYIRANFNYDPRKDNLIPCQDIGLKFKAGDVLEIVEWSDPSWWQARKVNYKEPPGLIPSQDLEERRKCFVHFDDADYNQLYCCSAGTKRNKRYFDYFVSQNIDFDRAELFLYEPVEKMPPFKRKTLALVSHPALENSKNKLIERIIDYNPDKFAEAKRATTRPISESEKERYLRITEEEMSEGLSNNEFLYNKEDSTGYLEGITFASILQIMKESKLCLIDCQPDSLKLLHNSVNFLPYVIFLTPPSVHKIEVFDEGTKEGANTIRRKSKEIALEYNTYFDQTIELEEIDSTIKKILDSMEKLATETQWVPRNWVYS